MAIDVRSGGVMPVQKQVRINPAGRIVDPDRQIHVSQEDGGGAGHKVEFRHVGTGVPSQGHTIAFVGSSPFTGAATFDVGATNKVQKDVDRDKLPGVYKYRVLDKATGDETDDPDVIVD
jgi:hypothetical protein